MAQRLACLAHNQKVGGSNPLVAMYIKITYCLFPVVWPIGSGSRPDERKLRVGSNPTVGNFLIIKIQQVDLSEWSKEPGLGPGMFACAGSNPVVNNLINYKISSMNFIIFSLYKL